MHRFYPHRKTIALVLLLVLLCTTLLLIGCNPTPPDIDPDNDPTDNPKEDIPMLHLIQDGISGYTVVRPEECASAVSNMSVALRRALETVGGTDDVDIATDFEDAAEKEILVGNTNRPETAEVTSRLGSDDFRIEIVGDKVVIVGKTDTAVVSGVRYLMKNVLNYNSLYDYTPAPTLSIPRNLCVNAEVVVQTTATDPRNAADRLILVANVLDYGAIGDGATDDTKAFQAAIDYAYSQGGGTVYAPAGQYLIKGNLTVKRSVMLAGAWVNPDENPEDIKTGTVLISTGNKGKADGTPLVTVGASAGVLGLTVYYPEQSLSDPIAYPATFLIKDNLANDGTQHAASIQNVTIVNAWRGIAADQGNQLPRIDSVYMTVLDYGFRINQCYDCARLTNMSLSPDYWAAYTGERREDVAKVTGERATGFILMRTDGQMMYDIRVKDCNIGLSLIRDTSTTGETAGYTNILKMDIQNCRVGVYCEYNSASFTNSSVVSSDENAVCIQLTATANGRLQFYDCTLESPNGTAVIVESGSTATLAIQNSTFTTAPDRYAVTTEGSVIMLCNNDFGNCAKAYDIANGTLAAVVTNNKFSGDTRCALDADNATIQTTSASRLPATTDTTLELPALPPVIVSSDKAIFNVKEYGAEGDGKTDDTNAFIKALADAKAAGGGTVYVPAGYYLTTEPLTVPGGVELRGIHESMHVTTGEGSVIYVTSDKGNVEGTPFITMEESSGVRGLTFWYPEQAWNNIQEYPWTISVQGQDCVIRNICFGNAFRGINMASADCGGHYLDNVTGYTIQRAITLDGSSKKGVMMNTHFNASFYFAVWGTKLSDASGAFGASGMDTALFQYANANLTAFTMGEATEEQVLFIFNYRARYGLDFTGGFEGKILGCGVDGSLCGLRVTGEYDEDLVLVNLMNDVVPGTTPEGNLGVYIDIDNDSTVRMVASGVSSYNFVPSDLLILKNGNLVLDNFQASYTPASGNGAIHIENGYAEISGIEFKHTGRLDAQGNFTSQSESNSLIDILVDKNGSLDLYSAVGRDFYHDSINGDTIEYSYIVTK